MVFAVVLRGRDPSAVAVLLEDGAAITGIFVATISLMLAHLTLNPVYDAVGSITIGGVCVCVGGGAVFVLRKKFVSGLLGAVALFLINRNSSALVGRYVLASCDVMAPPTAHPGLSLRKG